MGSKNKAERSCCDDNYGLNREEQIMLAKKIVWLRLNDEGIFCESEACEGMSEGTYLGM